MFKTLIATCLLTFSCSGGTLKVDKPRKEYVPSMLVSGYYTFNSTFDFTDYDSTHTLEFDDSYDISVYCARTGNGGTNSVYSSALSSLSLEFSDYFTFNLDYITNTGYDDGTYNIYYESYGNIDSFTIDDLVSYFEGRDDPRFISSQFFVRNFMFYVGTPFALYGDDLEFFLKVFNSDGNVYTSFYNGWYTYGRNWYDGDLYWELQDMYFTVDNTILTNYVHQEDIVYYSGHNLGNNTLVEVDVWNEPNVYTVVPPVRISGMLPYNVRVIMDVEGNFDYIVVPEETEWYEMILAVMDAPLYYLTSLFDFKLFGISLFVAFSSLLTLLVVVTIVKKVV